MRTRALVTTTLLVALLSGTGIAVSHAADLLWQVENPFRFFKCTRPSPCMRRRSTPCADPPASRCRRTSSGGRAPPQRSRLQGRIDAGSLRRDRRPALCAEPARLGGADAGRHLLRERWPAAPLFAGLRAQIFLGLGQGRLHPAGRPHGADPDRARAARRRDRRLHLDLAAAQAGRQARDQEARLQGQAHHRARSLFARPRRLGRLGHGEIAGRPRARRSERGGRGPLHRRARRFVRLGRKQSGPAGASSAPRAR